MTGTKVRGMAPSLEQARVGHVLGQRVFEDVDPLGPSRPLVQELPPRQLTQRLFETLWMLHRSLEQPHGHFSAKNRGVLQ